MVRGGNFFMTFFNLTILTKMYKSIVKRFPGRGWRGRGCECPEPPQRRGRVCGAVRRLSFGSRGGHHGVPLRGPQRGHGGWGEQPLTIISIE